MKNGKDWSISAPTCITTLSVAHMLCTNCFTENLCRCKYFAAKHSMWTPWFQKKKEFRTFRLQLGAGGVRNPDRSGSCSGLVAAAFLDWAHEVDQDQVFHDLGPGPRALHILGGFALGSIASQRQTGKRRRYGGEGRRGTAAAAA